MTNEEKISAWFKRFNQRFDEAVPTVIAETAVEYFKERFVEKDWDGKAWQPTKKPNSRGSLMNRTSQLMSTVRPAKVSASSVIISAGSSRVPYARVHNEGLRVRGSFNVRPHTNNNFMGTGKRVQIRGHNRQVDFQMPQRQFMGHSAILNKRIIKRLKQIFNEK